jgi:hypothetical protein
MIVDVRIFTTEVSDLGKAEEKPQAKSEN